MKQITPLKLTCVGAFVAALGVGCASSGTAHYDANSDNGVSVAASADAGTDRDVRIASSTDMDSHDSRGSSAQMDTGSDTATVVVNNEPVTVEGGDRITMSALSFSPETRANKVNIFPFYDNNWNLRTIDTYVFTPDEDASVQEFTTAVSPGTLYNEAAGGTPEVVSTGTGRAILHSPNPR